MIRPVELEPRSAFTAKSEECLEDDRIARFFKEGLVSPADVIDALVNGDAFSKAAEKESHKRYSEVHDGLCDLIKENAAIRSSGALNAKTLLVAGGSLAAIALVLIQVIYFSIPVSDIALASIAVAIVSSILSTRHDASRRTESSSGCRARHPERRLGAIAAISLPWLFSLIAMMLPYIIMGFSWTFLIVATAWMIVAVITHLLSSKQTRYEFFRLLGFWKNSIILAPQKAKIVRLQKEWLDDCAEDVIMPEAVLAINTILGKDKDLLLVEQDTTGLRERWDPTLRVPTSSERKVISRLAQVDGGSIVLLGPHGAGKTSLLKKFSKPESAADIAKWPGIPVYMNAPAEYVRREFVAELLQKLCEAYLTYAGYPLPKPIYTERKKHPLRQLLRPAASFSWLLLRSVASLALVIWILKPYLGADARKIYISAMPGLRHLYGEITHDVYIYLVERIGRYWTIVRAVVVLLALAIFPTRKRWRSYIHLPKEPPLVKKAYQHLHRLQVQKSATWGKSISLPLMRGSTLNWNSGGTVSYTPWSANELVSRTQDFIQEITSSFTDSDHKLTIAIDEIDRIGSLDDVKKFFYEIKPLSDISKCFFLAAATENISSIFTQHPAIRQSNSADDFRTVDVAPLNFTETRDLLLKRVPGFTDPYVYLVLALSGGLPRELIRVTYRLVDVKQELRNIDNGRYPRLAELALTLAKDEVCDRIEATRARLLDLHLHDGWQTFIQHIHSTLGHLQSLLPPARTAYTWEAYHLIEELSKLPVPEYPENAGARPTPVPEAEDNARELAKRLTTFAYLGITVIDAFSNESFDLERIQQAAAAGSEDSYQRLAAACAELSISPDMSRTTLRSFRGSLPRPDP